MGSLPIIEMLCYESVPMGSAMDVLIIGGEDALVDALINRFYKENHRIFWLTGSRTRTKRLRRVFGQFDFPLDGEAVASVIADIAPDICIYTGAYDPNIDWGDPSAEGRRFLAGVNNVIIAAGLIADCRMVFLSSEDVFPEGSDEDLAEEVRIEPSAGRVGMKSGVLLNAEDSWLSSGRLYNRDAIVLRMDHVYSLPLENQLRSECVTNFCLEAFRSGKLYANENHIFSPLFVSDAVEAVYRVCLAQGHERTVYHISSGEVVDEGEVADLVQAALGGECDVAADPAGLQRRIVLSGEVARVEFDLRVHHRLADVIPQIVSYLKSHARHFLKGVDAPGNSFARLVQRFWDVFGGVVPTFENFVCFGLAFFLTGASANNEVLAAFDFYLLYTLLFAVMFGQNQAMLSALLSLVGYLFARFMAEGAWAVAIDLRTYVWVAQIFVVGLTVGRLRDSINTVREEAAEEVAYMSERRDDAIRINDENVRMKKVLEGQLVNQQDSLGRVYEITSQLSHAEDTAVLFDAAQVVARLMQSNDVALYQVSFGPYARLFAATSEPARRLGNSVRYQDLGALSEAVAHHQVFINRTMDPKLPSMAYCIYSEDNPIILILVWDVPWDRMTLSQANVLTVTCALIQEAVVRANRSLELLNSERIVPGTETVLDDEAFEKIRQMYKRAGAQGLAPSVLLEVTTRGEDLPGVEKKLRSKMRAADYIGVRDDRDDAVFVLLSNATPQSAEIVLGRFADLGYPSEIIEVG